MEKTALVLAAFGAGRPEALAGIENIYQRARAAFPAARVEVCFTSNQVRRLWRKRREDRAWQEAHPQTPAWALAVKGPLAVMAELQDQGYRSQLVQPLHVYAGEEYQDLKSYLAGLNSIQTLKPKWRPFRKLALGRPALGEPGPRRPYVEDLERAARALAPEVEEASRLGAALVYVGHGNHYFSTGVYHELQVVMQRLHPGKEVLVGTVEGLLDARLVRDRLLAKRAVKVLLRPLMVVAGVHAAEDMCGPGEDSWRAILEAAGLEVECRLAGLGQNDSWADIYLEHARDAAEDHGIALE